MHGDGTNIVGMCLEARDFFRRVVVVYADLEVVRAAYNPILAGDESTRADWDICELECFDDCLCKK